MRHLLFAGLCLAALAAPAAGQDLPTLRIALADDADLLDPTLARTFVGRIVFAGLCDKLFDLNEKLEIVPQLATGYDWTDNKTLVMHLRPGVKFHDGTPMDAAAVKYSLDRHLTMDGSGRRGELAAMDHAEIVDPLTLRVTLKTPSAPFVAQLTDRAGMIVSPKAAEAAGKNFSLHPVCAGPFSFVERIAQDHITLDRFPDYWDAANIHLGRVVYRTIVDSSVKLANIQAGSVDFAERMAPTDVDAVKADKKLKLAVYDGLGYQGITFNINHGPRAQTPVGQDARVRRAFALAIDRAALVQVVYNGMFTPAAQAIAAGSPFYDPAIAIAPRDPAKAKALLLEAGLKLPVTLELTTTNSPTQQQEAEVIQSMAAEAGFDVKVKTMEFSSSLDADDRGDFTAHLFGWSGRSDPDGNIWNFVHTGAPLNIGGYSNKDVDSLLEQARAVTDIPARRALYGKAAAIVNQDVPLLYLYTTKAITAMSTRVQGFRPVPDAMIRLSGVSMTK